MTRFNSRLRLRTILNSKKMGIRIAFLEVSLDNFSLSEVLSCKIVLTKVAQIETLE